MDALDVLKVCVRRWWVMLPIIGLAVGVGFGLVRQQQPMYGAYASYALIYADTQPRAVDDPDPILQNPLAANNGSLLGEALVADLMSSDQQEALGDPGMSGTDPNQSSDGTRFTVGAPSNSHSYYVNAWGPDPQILRNSIDAILGALPAEAEEIQTRAGAPANAQLEPFVTTQTQVTELAPGSPMKVLLALLGVGLLAGAAVSIVVDRLVARRRQRGSDSQSLPVGPVGASRIPITEVPDAPPALSPVVTATVGGVAAARETKTDTTTRARPKTTEESTSARASKGQTRSTTSTRSTKASGTGSATSTKSAKKTQRTRTTTAATTPTTSDAHALPPAPDPGPAARGPRLKAVPHPAPTPVADDGPTEAAATQVDEGAGAPPASVESTPAPASASVSSASPSAPSASAARRPTVPIRPSVPIRKQRPKRPHRRPRIR